MWRSPLGSRDDYSRGRSVSLTLNQLFNDNYYLALNPNVAEAVRNGSISSGFEHFIQFGRFENRDPSPLFDTRFYIETNPNIAPDVYVDDYIQFGQFENRGPSLVFDPTFYLNNNADVAAAIAQNPNFTAIEHFVEFGQFEGRDPSAFFDERSYLANHPDVAGAVAAGQTTAIAHYLAFGAAEGREFTPGQDEAIEAIAGVSLNPSNLNPNTRSFGDDWLTGGVGAEGADGFWAIADLSPVGVNAIADFQSGTEVKGFESLAKEINFDAIGMSQSHVDPFLSGIFADWLPTESLVLA